MKKLVLVTLLLMFMVCSAYAKSVCLHRPEKLFTNSAELIRVGMGIQTRTIPDNKHEFLSAIRSANDILYILSHGCRTGIKIRDGVVVSWDKVRQNINAELFIIDTCYSYKGLQIEGLDGTGKVGVATTGYGYAFNPKIVDNQRFSVAAAAFAIYFSPELSGTIDATFPDLRLRYYIPEKYILSRIMGLSKEEAILRDIARNHMQFYLVGINNEGISSFVNLMFKQNPRVQALYTLQYKIY